MRVMCIDDSPNRKDGSPSPLKMFCNYTVVDQSVCPDNQMLHYILSEFSPDLAFGAFRFLEISDIDETELASKREQLETIKQ